LYFVRVFFGTTTGIGGGQSCWGWLRKWLTPGETKNLRKKNLRVTAVQGWQPRAARHDELELFAEVDKLERL